MTISKNYSSTRLIHKTKTLFSLVLSIIEIFYFGTDIFVHLLLRNKMRYENTYDFIDFKPGAIFIVYPTKVKIEGDTYLSF